MKNFLKKLPLFSSAPKAYIAGAATLGIAIIAFTTYAITSRESVPPMLAITGTEMLQNEDLLTTVQPVLLSSSSSTLLIGTVLSHETANIYPRRDGIVEDIYVDIGDSVKKNQVVALLLPKGVEGQSAAMIAEKRARKSQAESNLSTAQKVAEETVISARQNIKEKEANLLIAQREQESLIEKFAEYEADIAQKREQAFNSIQNIRQIIEGIILGSNTRTGIDIIEDDLMDNLGRLDGNGASRYVVTPLINTLYRIENEYMAAMTKKKSTLIDVLFQQSFDLINATNSLLQATPSSPSSKRFDKFSYDDLSGRLNKMIVSQDTILKAKEKIEDAKSTFAKLKSAEPELYSAYFSGNTNGVRSNKVIVMETQIQTAHNSLALTDANQQQIVERQRSMLEVSNAMLQSEVAQSGHRQIRSPFTGTISRRFIDVGQIVMPSISAFELTDVPTSLAKKAKREIKFGLPEHMQSAVTIGDSVSFFLSDKEDDVYLAEVTRISPQVDMQSHTITVQAKLSDEINLPHHTSVRVRIVDNSTPIFRVPSFSVKRDGDSNIIWVQDPVLEKPKQVRVNVLSEDGEFAEISGNISEATQLILDPPDLLAMPNMN